MKTLKILFTSSILSLALAGNAFSQDGGENCSDCIMVPDLNVEFKNDSTIYMNAAEKTEIEEFAAFLKETDLYAVIEGHTSKFATANYNLKLSSDRAVKIRAELIKLGVKPAQVKAIGFGESSPLYDNNTEIGAQKNRRVIAEVFNDAIELAEYVSSERSRISEIKYKEQ